MPPRILVPAEDDDERSIWVDGYWTEHLAEWQSKLYELFPTQQYEIQQLSPKQCGETMEMYEREYIAWLAARRMVKR